MGTARVEPGIRRLPQRPCSGDVGVRPGGAEALLDRVRLERSYATLTALEHDAFHARIWGGLHFRDAMDDGYYLGHTTADRVMKVVH